MSLMDGVGCPVVLIWICYWQARTSHKRLRVVRLETTAEGRRIVGLHIPNPAVEAVLSGRTQCTQNTFQVPVSMCVSCTDVEIEFQWNWKGKFQIFFLTWFAASGGSLSTEPTSGSRNILPGGPIGWQSATTLTCSCSLSYHRSSFLCNKGLGVCIEIQSSLSIYCHLLVSFSIHVAADSGLISDAMVPSTSVFADTGTNLCMGFLQGWMGFKSSLRSSQAYRRISYCCLCNICTHWYGSRLIPSLIHH